MVKTKILAGLAFAAALTAAAKEIALDWKAGGEQPVEVVDFGPATVGGYAVFEVAEYAPAPDGKLPVVRLSYSTHPDGISPTGDFTREGCADYLHVDNPVLPANVNRHELYTIPRKGRFVAPLIQGQERYVRVALDTPGASVKLASLDIVNAGVHAEGPAAGSFSAEDPRYATLWNMGAWTCQLASFPNPDAWRVVDGVLIPRKLEKGDPDGWCRFIPDFEGTLEVTYEFRWNPHFPKGAFKVFTGCRNDRPEVVQTLAQEGPDGVIRTASIPLKPGRFGFRLAKEEWPMVHKVVVKDKSGAVRFEDDFSIAAMTGKPFAAANWVYTEAVPYLADGGKRDRLVWSGDLWWAQKTMYYAFGPQDPYLAGALRLLAFNQTPEGFCHAAPYAENAVKPRTGEYGHFASDEFSAWLVPCAWEHLLHTGDFDLARELWPAVDLNLRYIASHMGADGLFAQRWETSKHAGAMECGDVRQRLYPNLIYWMCWRDGAKLARALGHADRAGDLESRAAAHADAIRKHFRNAQTGKWTAALGPNGWDPRAFAMLLASGFATPEEALGLAQRWRHIGVGKEQSMCVRGKFRYGFTQNALREIADGNWYALCDPTWKGAHCCTECMYLTSKGWWDESHPDTVLSDVFSEFILGVAPLEPGFRRFRIAPQMTPAFDRASGRVPTRFGDVDVAWTRKDGVLEIAFTVPAGAEAEVGGTVYGAGRHVFTRAVAADELVDPSVVAGAASGPQRRDFGLVVSQPYDSPQTDYAQVFDLDKVVAVDSVTFFPPDRGCPDTLVVEGGTVPGEFRELRRFSGLKKSADPKKPLVADLRTVVGPPRIRYLRLSGTDLAVHWDGRTYAFRFDNIRVDYTAE